jgi:nucleotide-binding universal stress UspA family protein
MKTMPPTVNRKSIGPSARFRVTPGNPAPSSRPIRLQHILVPVDFSPEAKAALNHALVYARHYGARIHLLHVAPPIPYEADYGYGPVILQLPDEAREQRTKARLEAWARKWISPSLLGPVVVRTGDAGEEIIQLAKEEDIDLVVLSPRTGAALACSDRQCVAEQVTRHAPCSVLTVKAKAPSL